MKKVIILSGGFDPLHIGHLRMFESAKDEGDIVIVGANSDSWLTRKKGQPFMIHAERLEILKAIKYIDYVYTFNDDDDTACDLIKRVIEKYKNHEVKIFFGNGGDRNIKSTPEIEYCNKNGVGLLWQIGGDKIQSSSDLIKGKNK
jgi:D-beta-D-heptose 7-phosphate kinase/D-beta-D-heptose 1-phosphate adenosyltransferase